MTHNPVFIGIVGASGAGKSTLCKKLKRISNQYEHIKLDNYFKHPRTFPRKYGYANWEKPSNIKFDVLLKHVKALARGKIIHTKSFPKKGDKPKPITLKPKKYILVEGFILLAHKAIRDFLDKRIYLDMPTKFMIKRRALRFGKSRSIDYDTRIAIPEYLKIGLKQKKFADHIIDLLPFKLFTEKTLLRILE